MNPTVIRHFRWNKKPKRRPALPNPRLPRFPQAQPAAPPAALLPPRRSVRAEAPWPCCGRAAPSPVFLSSPSFSCFCPKPRRPWMAGEGGGGTAVAPLAGARVRPEPRTAPSSGPSVVPFGARARALRGGGSAAVVCWRSGASVLSLTASSDYRRW